MAATFRAIPPKQVKEYPREILWRRVGDFPPLPVIGNESITREEYQYMFETVVRTGEYRGRLEYCILLED